MIKKMCVELGAAMQNGILVGWRNECPGRNLLKLS